MFALINEKPKKSLNKKCTKIAQLKVNSKVNYLNWLKWVDIKLGNPQILELVTKIKNLGDSVFQR